MSLFAKAEAMNPTKCKLKAVRNRTFLTEMYHKIAIGKERGLFFQSVFPLQDLGKEQKYFFFTILTVRVLKKMYVAYRTKRFL